MGPLRQTTIVSIADSSQIAVARRTAGDSARRVGLGETGVGHAELVVVELATNLLQHAGRGTLLFNEFVPEGVLQVLSIDNGPGMVDLQQCLVDGFTTSSTLGLGLGAVQRLATEMNAYSWPGKGTLIAAVVSDTRPAPLLPGVVCSALEGESASGDRWATVERDGQQLFLLVDGLGHGLLAATAAETAVDLFVRATATSPATLLEQMHTAMRSTRGAAVAIVSVDTRNRTLTFAGVGNISASVQSATGSVANLMSHNGTVGHQMRRVQNFTYPWQPGYLLLMHSDGITTRWKLGDFPGLWQASPALIAGLLFRDFRRERDDATVMAVRLG